MKTESTSPQPSPPAERVRQKRSWSKVQIKVGTDTVLFWPTPTGLHRRKKGSPKVRTEPWEKINDFITGDVFAFKFDNRRYEVWRGADGIHMRRNGADEQVLKWAQFIELIDGQRLLPI